MNRTLVGSTGEVHETLRSNGVLLVDVLFCRCNDMAMRGKQMLTNNDLEAFGYYDMIETNVTYGQPSISDMVEEFRVTMGQEKDASLSADLIHEEFNEWRSLSVFDICTTKEMKELADLVYVIYGYANSLGWDLDEAIRRVHKNNMERCVHPGGEIKRREDGKILKNPDAAPVDLSDLV